MKKYLLVSIILLVFNRLCAQNMEIAVQANSGLFHYAGNGAASTSAMIAGNQNYTDILTAIKTALVTGWVFRCSMWDKAVLSWACKQDMKF